jgi:hypothetical protein
MSERPPIERMKLYGERNTGTRFVKGLLKRNFDVPMLRASLGQQYEPRGDIKGTLEDHEWLIRRIAVERFNGIVNARLIPHSFGWKHMSPPIEAIRASEFGMRTLFVVLVKHPVFWAQSFKERPYDSFFRYDDMTFSQFVRHVFLPCERDNVPEVTYDSAVGLYAAKVDGYRALADLGVHFQLVRYEHLLLDVPGFLARLADLHGLPRRHDADVIREDSTKGDDEKLQDYQSKYRLDKVREAVSAEDYEFIMEKFGRDRLAWLGYEG